MKGNCVGGNRKRCNLRDNETTRSSLENGENQGKGMWRGASRGRQLAQPGEIALRFPLEDLEEGNKSRRFLRLNYTVSQRLSWQINLILILAKCRTQTRLRRGRWLRESSLSKLGYVKIHRSSFNVNGIIRFLRLFRHFSLFRNKIITVESTNSSRDQCIRRVRVVQVANCGINLGEGNRE